MANKCAVDAGFPASTAHSREALQHYPMRASRPGASAVGRTADGGRTSRHCGPGTVGAPVIGTGPADAITGMATVGAPVSGAAGVTTAGAVASAGWDRHTMAQ